MQDQLFEISCRKVILEIHRQLVAYSLITHHEHAVDKNQNQNIELLCTVDQSLLETQTFQSSPQLTEPLSGRLSDPVQTFPQVYDSTRAVHLDLAVTACAVHSIIQLRLDENLFNVKVKKAFPSAQATAAAYLSAVEEGVDESVGISPTSRRSPSAPRESLPS